MASSTPCDICCEAFTKTTRKPVECLACHHIACMKCVQTYLVSNPNTECMSCHAPWTHDFLHATFPKAWISGAYRKFREGVLLDIEKAQLPDSQHLVRNFNTAQTLRQTLKDEAAEKIALRRRLYDIDVNKWNLKHRVDRISMSRFHTDGLGGGGESRERRGFIRACPVDGCRGFLSASLKCGICEIYACGECFGIIGADRHGDHTCDPNDIETAKYIKKESRPCPTCAINISKIDGCDQMFCVQCRTAFSWRTGGIVTGTIHNPHYFEMLRNASVNGEIPRQEEDADAQCQGVENPTVFTRALFRKLEDDGIQYQSHEYLDITKSQRHVAHLFGDAIPSLRNRYPDTSDLRLRYLLGNFDDEAFKRHLALREKTMQKHAALVSCYEARVHMTTDLVRAYIAEEIGYTNLLERLTGIHKMMTGFLTDISERYQCAVEYGHCPHLREESVKRQRVE